MALLYFLFLAHRQKESVLCDGVNSRKFDVVVAYFTPNLHIL